MDVQAAVAIEIDQQERQSLRPVGQPHRSQATACALVVEDAARAVADTQVLHQLGIIGRRHQVQVAVAVQIPPRHRVGGLGRRRVEQAIEFGIERIAPPQLRRTGAAGEGDVEQAVAVGIDHGHRACVSDRQNLAAEAQVALVPQQGGRPCQVGEHQVEVPVAVQIARGDAGAVTVEQLDRESGR